VAVIDESHNFSLQKTISAIEQRLDTAPSRDLEAGYDDYDDVMPAVANEMGAGTFLPDCMYTFLIYIAKDVAPCDLGLRNVD
jgi:hypothetical protein